MTKPVLRRRPRTSPLPEDVLATLRERGPLSAYEITDQMRETGKRSSYSTSVYRALDHSRSGRQGRLLGQPPMLHGAARKARRRLSRLHELQARRCCRKQAPEGRIFCSGDGSSISRPGPSIASWSAPVCGASASNSTVDASAQACRSRSNIASSPRAKLISYPVPVTESTMRIPRYSAFS